MLSEEQIEQAAGQPNYDYRSAVEYAKRMGLPIEFTGAGAAPDGVTPWTCYCDGSGTSGTPAVAASDYDALAAKLAEALRLATLHRDACMDYAQKLAEAQRDLDAALAAVRDVDGIVGNREIYRKWADKHAAIIAKAEERK